MGQEQSKGGYDDINQVLMAGGLSSDERMEHLKRLLEQGASVNEVVSDGYLRGCAALHLLLGDSDLSADEKLLLLEPLLAAGADVNQTVTSGSGCGYAALHLVLLFSDLSADQRLLLVERLLAAGAAVNQTVTDGDDAWRGHAPLHLVLLRSGLSPDERLLLVDRLLAAGAAVNQTVTNGDDTWSGHAPLHLVLLHPFLSTDECLLLVEPLLAAGASVNQTVTGDGTMRGYAPLHLVLHRSGLYADECLLLLERLLEAGAVVNQGVTDGALEGHTPLQIALENNLTSSVSMLVRYGASNDAIDQRCHAPLHTVLASSDLSADERLVQLEDLLEAGEEVNQTVTEGDTWRGYAPLHLVFAFPDLSADKCLPLLERLFEAGAAVNQTITDGIWRGLAPLHMVLATIDMSADKCLPLLERLIEAGAAINQIITDGIWRGFAPLHMVLAAIDLSADECLLLLEPILTAGAAINQIITGDGTLRGAAPLHLVLTTSGWSTDERLLLLEPLLAAGAATNQTVAGGSLEGHTPLQIALKRNLMTSVSMLIRYGASIDDIDQSDISKLIFEGKLSLVIEEQLKNFTHRSDPSVSSENLVYSAVKMILLGDVRAGKTSIVRTLDRQIAHLTDDGEDGRTIGVEITKMQLSSHNFTVFDFGGHRSYLSTYQLFCSSRTLYLIAVDLSTFNPANSYTQFDHWYESTTQRALKAVFIVIGSKLDQCKDKDTKSKTIIDRMKNLESRAVASLSREMKSLKMQEDNNVISALHVKRRKDRIQYLLDNRPIIPEDTVNVNVCNPESMQRLETIINQTIAAHSENLPVKEIPKTWEKTEQQILLMEEPYITKSKFYDISEQGNICGEERDKFLNHEISVGSVLHYGEAFQPLDITKQVSAKHKESRKSLKLSDIVFIKPQWIMKILGCIFNHRLHKDNPDHPWLLALTTEEVNVIQSLLSEGKLSKGTLESLLEHFKLGPLLSIVLELLEKFSMCFEILKHSSSVGMLKTEQYFCFPGLFRQEPPDIAHIWTRCCTDDLTETIVIVQYNTDKSPQGFFEQISVKSNALLVDQKNWKSGMVGKLNDERSCMKMELKEINDSECLLIQVRTPNEDVTRTNIRYVISTVRYTAKYYPAVVFSIHLPCHRCFKESESTPSQTMQMWPADNFTSFDAKNVLLSCRNSHPTVRVKEIFPIPDIDTICDMFVIPTIGKNWVFLTRELFPSINQADKAVHYIAYVHGIQVEKIARHVITRWQQECGQEACMNVLITALSHMDRKDILQRLNVGEQDVREAETSTLESDKRTDTTRFQAATKRVIILTSKELEIAQWKHLYRYLNRSKHVEAELTTIDMDHEEPHEKVHAMLKKWIRDVGESATFRAVIKALESIIVGRRDIAEKLRDVCRNYDINLTSSEDPQRLVL